MIEWLAMLAMTATACPPATEASVRAAFDEWLIAYRGRDLEGTMRIFDPEVRFAYQGMPDAGWNSLRQAYETEFAATARSEWRGEWEEVIVSGDLATAIARWREYIGGAAEPRAENRAVDILRRGADCRWRIVRSLNYPARAPQR